MKPNTGQMYSISSDATYPYKPPRYGQYGEGKLNHQNYSLNQTTTTTKINQNSLKFTILHSQTTTQNIINSFYGKQNSKTLGFLRNLKKKYLKISLKI